MDGPLAGVAEKLKVASQDGRSPRRLILFPRYPIAGKVKTRLITALGAEGAAALHRRLVLRPLRTAHEARRTAPAELGVHFDRGTEQTISHWLGDNTRFVPQRDGDLGSSCGGAGKSLPSPNGRSPPADAGRHWAFFGRLSAISGCWPAITSA